MPSTEPNPEASLRDDETATFLLTTYRRLAVVGASATKGKPANDAPLRMRNRGYDVLPVNPTIPEWEGIPTFRSVLDVPRPEIVDVFRKPEEVPAIAREAVQAGAKALWLQLGITSTEARNIAGAAEIPYLEDRCVNREYLRLQALGVGLPGSPARGRLVR